ncbi:MAG: glycosyltransferase family 2 protein [Pseudanabaena sp. CAN_BIN31]|nr:glycosyltransferase family 2 protein [Pseudanabaena sp. CAN_BIN31]
MIKTPVAFIIFNRPDTTAKVFEAIRQAKPPKLFVIADGPRSDRPDEAAKCAAARAIIDGVDWECEVLTNYSDVNLSCKSRVSSGLDWVFDNVEEAIVLEDDCLPHPSFFTFCEELLDKYRYDERIAVISGQNVQFGRQRTDYSYYFSRYNHCWVWASWRRSWKNFDYDMKLWDLIRDSDWLGDIFQDKRDVKVWTKIFQNVYDQKINSWAYRWTLSCWLQNQVSILSNVNLISNIGFGSEGTNTRNSDSVFSETSCENMIFPLNHPPFMIRDAKSDDFTQKTLYGVPLLIIRIKRKVKAIYSSILGKKHV